MLHILLFLFSFNSYAVSDCMHDTDKLKCLDFVKNFDGDTMTFNIPGLHP